MCFCLLSLEGLFLTAKEQHFVGTYENASQLILECIFQDMSNIVAFFIINIVVL